MKFEPGGTWWKNANPFLSVVADAPWIFTTAPWAGCPRFSTFTLKSGPTLYSPYTIVQARAVGLIAMSADTSSSFTTAGSQISYPSGEPIGHSRWIPQTLTVHGSVNAARKNACAT